MRPLRIVTWNLNGLDPAHLDERTEDQCLTLLLREDPPHVVLLQEVVARSWHAHLKHHFAAAGYAAVPVDPLAASSSEYVSMMFVSQALPVVRQGAERFPNTHMGRHLVWAEVAWLEQPLLLCTSHLESTKGASEARVAQLGAIVAGLRNHPGPAVFGGDTNLRKAEEAAVNGLGEVVDAWTDVGAPANQRATWPSQPRDKRPGARFDRVLVHGVEVIALRLLGARSPRYPFPPSDHLAVEVWLQPS